MKKGILILFCLVSARLLAQPYGNEWINYTQDYYKIPIAADGVYRINYQTLVNANIPLSTLDPRNFQLFARGEEQPLYVKGEGDGVFNTTDYIEFYGEKNDGWLDSALYNGRNNQPNPYYSLINDTIYYYLSWNSSTANSRYQEENAINFGDYFAASFFWKENLQVYNSNYFDGAILNSGATNPEYTEAEGWMDVPLTLGTQRDKVISTPNRYISGPFVDFEIRVAGASDWSAVNNGDHHLRITFGNETVDEIFDGYELREVRRSFSPTQLNKGDNFIRFQSIDDRNAGVDRTGLAYMRILYPHTLSLSNSSNFDFQIDDASNQSAQYLEFRFFNGGSNPILYDLTNNKKVRVVETLSDYRAIIPNGNGRKRCLILAENEVRVINELIAVEGNGSFTDHQNLISDTSFFIITHSDLFAQATTYASYRRSKGMDVLVIDIEELYDQYAYGINKHPLAIRNFMDNVLSNWPHPPSHLFLIGKSVTAKSHRKSDPVSVQAYAQNLLPSLGNPSADNLLISGLQGTNLETPIPLGRLSAKNLSDVDAYLDKVIEYEAAAPAKWMKRAIHFAGGKFAFEANTHENYLNGYAQDFESTNYGGKAFLFRKSSSAPYQTTLADSVRGLINSGVSIMTFFGHSSATGGFDISIDSPNDFQNKGKYPVLLGNSCFAGNYHQAGILSTSEEYVLERNKGVIAFIANGNLGIGSFLNRYSSAFYENLSRDHYGESLAECMRQAVKDVQSTAGIEALLKNVCIEMSLQGDPSLVMNAATQTDYVLESDHVFFSPEEVTTDVDSFSIDVRIDNIGLATSDSVLISFNRKFPVAGVSDTTILQKIAPVYFEQFVRFTFPVNIITDVGENEFTFVVDPFNEVAEIDENNNRIEFKLLIRSGEIIPVYPVNYAIIGQQAPTLSASTAFAFEKEKDYLFELDTNKQFNSPYKQSQNIRSIGGLLEWTPAVLQNMADSAVFFWRVSNVPAPGDPFNWRTHSFQYIPGETGFAQDHFDQFDENTFLFLRQNKSNQRLEYSDQVSELAVRTIGSPSNAQLNNIRYVLDADIREKGSCYPSPAILIAVLDSVTLDSWLSTRGNYGQANFSTTWCAPNRNRPEAIYSFQVEDSLQLFDMRDFLDNLVPDGHYIVAYNWFNINYSLIDALDTSILNAFDRLGSNIFQNIQDGHPFIFTGQKGNQSTVIEVVGDSIDADIELSRILTTSAEFGSMSSQNLGPSTDFSRLNYRFKSVDSFNKDEIDFQLLGIDAQQNESILLTNNSFVLDTNISAIIGNYEQLKLVVNSTDTLAQTPPQLERWAVNFVGLPDAALSPNSLFTVNKDSLEQGEILEVVVALRNVTSIGMDSLSLLYSVLDNRGEVHLIKSTKTAPLAADSSINLQMQIPTASFIGDNTLLIEVNPNQEQAEQNTFNNFGQYDFYVFPDRINPLLDVTFDGRHILNRDVVSANPVINVRLKDSNPFLAIDDTSSFSLYLTSPDGNEELIDVGLNANYDLQFIPASLPNNAAQMIYQPQLEDGIYQLRISARDKSGNASGSQDYRVEFEVITKSTVTHLLNYPNPFSTSTRFVFTLTGSQIPDQILIQIMTVTGKVVREIDENELGPIHIGNNVTQFAWDGKDEYGDQLANGVYFYTVKMRINGQNIERRETKVDGYFKKNFGKMYLLR